MGGLEGSRHSPYAVTINRYPLYYNDVCNDCQYIFDICYKYIVSEVKRDRFTAEEGESEKGRKGEREKVRKGESEKVRKGGSEEAREWESEAFSPSGAACL